MEASFPALCIAGETIDFSWTELERNANILLKTEKVITFRINFITKTLKVLMEDEKDILFTFKNISINFPYYYFTICSNNPTTPFSITLFN